VEVSDSETIRTKALVYTRNHLKEIVAYTIAAVSTVVSAIVTLSVAFGHDQAGKEMTAQDFQAMKAEVRLMHSELIQVKESQARTEGTLSAIVPWAQGVAKFQASVQQGAAEALATPVPNGSHRNRKWGEMERIWVWLRYKTIAKAIEALLKAGDDEHELGRISSGARADEHRAEAEEFHAAKSDLWSAQHKLDQTPMKNCSDESVHGNSAPIQITRFSLPKDARELIIGTVVAISIVVNIVIFALYQSTQRDLADAYKDIKTQVWVKQDKEEEKFQKFVAGPYAQLAGELKANEILFTQCKESRKWAEAG